jgi:hypothetical protein
VTVRSAVGVSDLDLLIASLNRWRFLIHFMSDHLRDIITASCHKSFISHVVVVVVVFTFL